MHSKAQLRDAALSARSALGRDQRAVKSALIATSLQGWEAYRRARSLCFYASFGSEVQTAELLELALRSVPLAGEGQGDDSPACQTVCLPRVQGDELVIHRINDYLLPAGRPVDESGAAGPAASDLFAALVRSPMGMPEPPAALPVVPPHALDLILVPGSAFCALSGHRIGYGKGFYDRLLARAPQALKIGLCFDVQLFAMEGFPFDPHDIALDVLVSESGIRDLRTQKG